MAVYFIQAPTGHIKIGVARSPKKRLAALQTAWPSALRILRTEPGGSEKERDYHLQFAEFRVGGEWFECRGALADFLALEIGGLRFPKLQSRPKCENCSKRPKEVGRFCGPCAIHAAMSDPENIERPCKLDQLAARFDRYKKIATLVGIGTPI